MPCINKMCGLLNRTMIKQDLEAPVATRNTRGPAPHARLESHTSSMHRPLHEQLNALIHFKTAFGALLAGPSTNC